MQNMLIFYIGIYIYIKVYYFKVVVLKEGITEK